MMKKKSEKKYYSYLDLSFLAWVITDDFSSIPIASSGTHEITKKEYEAILKTQKENGISEKGEKHEMDS